jgi:crotonobetainyl-CoA:carnitine CoA-transferase CaiB-like acyl-CoA transferase
MRLDEVTVLDFTHLLPGPYATQLLADMGAEVLKVEPPDGDGARHLQIGETSGSLFSMVNRGKRSVALDLKADGADEVVGPLLEGADVVVEQFKPGVARRLGIDPERAADHRPDVVYCSISGYGQDGPYSDRVGHDLNYVGLTGVLDMTRTSLDDPPVVPGVPIADMAGGLFAAMCVTSSLLARELGNQQGEYIDVSLTDVSLSLAQVLAAEALFGGTPEPGRAVLSGGYPCYGVYEAGDGDHFTLAAIEAHFWRRLCTELDQPGLADKHMSDDTAVRKAVRTTLEDEFAARPAHEWVTGLSDAGIPAGPVAAFADVTTDPQLRHRGMVMKDDGVPPRIGFPARTSGGTAEPLDPPPGLGEHTDDILADLGFDAEHIDRLRDDGVVKSERSSDQSE